MGRLSSKKLCQIDNHSGEEGVYLNIQLVLPSPSTGTHTQWTIFTSLTIQKDANCKHVEIVEFGSMYDRLIDVNIQTFQVQVMSASPSEIKHTRTTVI